MKQPFAAGVDDRSEPPGRGGLRALVLEGWRTLGRASTFFTLLLTAAALLAFILWVSRAGDLWRSLGNIENPLLARFDTFLGLHAPWEAWWLVALGVATLISGAAFVLEHIPFWATPVPERDAIARYPAASLTVRRVRAAAACLGEAVELAEGRGQLLLLAPSRLHRVATSLLLLGSLVVSLGVVLASRGSLLGEMVLTPGQASRQVLTPGPGGQPRGRALPFSVRAVSVASASVAKLVVEVAGSGAGEAVSVTPQTPLRHGTTWITPRLTRLTDGGERFRLRLVEGDLPPVEASVVPRESVVAPGGQARYRVRDFSEDLGGAGPAVWVERIEGEQVREGFWVFENFPDFDRDNRDDPVALELLGLERQSQLVAGVVHLAGVGPLLGGGGLLLLSFLLLWIGVRRSRVLEVGSEMAWGHPMSDPKVNSALAALGDGAGS